MIEKLFMLGVMLIPMTGVPGVPFFGELKNELSAYIFLLALGLSFVFLPKTENGQPHVFWKQFYGLPTIFAIMVSVILLSFIANFSDIQNNMFQGRSGLNKFISSFILIFYGFSLAGLTYVLAGRVSWDKLIIKPLMGSVLLCAGFSVLELLRYHSGAVDTLYGFLSSFVHGGSTPPVWDERLRSVASEPPDFANTAGYIWPWLLAAIQFSNGKEKMRAFVLFLLLNLMIFLSEARTSYVIISGLAFIYGALRLVYLPLKQRGKTRQDIPLATLLLLMLLPLAFLGIALHADEIVAFVVKGERVSNLSRLASITAGFSIFRAHPFFGAGFGQFGFHVTEYMPSWGFLSYEVQYWLFGGSDYWPAAYSIYARFAADLGILGLLMWLGIWLSLAGKILFASLRYHLQKGQLPMPAYPLIMSCFCILLAGIPNDSVRAPMIWINMGLCCRYLFDLRKALKEV